MGFQLLEIPVSLSEVSNYLIKEGRKCYEKRQFDIGLLKAFTINR